MKKYKIAKGLSFDALEEAVCELMNNGWQPQGGMSLENWPGYGVAYCQAMIRRPAHYLQPVVMAQIQDC